MTVHSAVEAGYRAAPALLVLAALLLAEWRWPWRPAQPGRWGANLALGLLSSLTVLALPLASMISAAYWAAAQPFGLFHWLHTPHWLAVLLSVVLLDFALYAQHRALHSGPLWRLHRVHHLDPMLDVTSGLRFHPFEALASALYKSALVALLGAPVVAVAASITLTVLASLFTHANLRLPAWLETLLRPVLITPGLHRIHHSTAAEEAQSNFGSVLCIWDRLLGSFKARARAGEGLALGVENEDGETRLIKMLNNPFKAQQVQ